MCLGVSPMCAWLVFLLYAQVVYCALVCGGCAQSSWFLLMCARGVFPMCSTGCASLMCTSCVLLSCVHGLFYGKRKGCVSFSCVHGLCFAPFPELGTPAFMGGKHLCQRITARDHLWEMTYEEDCWAFLSRMSGLWGARDRLSFHILTLVASLCHGHRFVIFKGFDTFRRINQLRLSFQYKNAFVLSSFLVILPSAIDSCEYFPWPCNWTQIFVLTLWFVI